MGVEVGGQAGKPVHEAAQQFGGDARVHVLDRGLEAAGYVLPGAARPFLLADVLLATRFRELDLRNVVCIFLETQVGCSRPT
jgi:hypothetical protein